MLLHTVLRCCTLLLLVNLCICGTSESEVDGNESPDAPEPEASENSPLQKVRGEIKGPEVDGDDGNDDKEGKNGDNKDADIKDEDDKDGDGKDGDEKDDDDKDDSGKDDNDKDDDDKDINDDAQANEGKEDEQERLAGQPDESDVTFDLTKESANKFVQVSLMSAMPGFSFSPSEMVKFKIWPQGAIPFYIDEFSYDKILRDKIREYLDVTNSLTGLRFLEIARPPEDDKSRWVFFINRRGQLNCTDYSPSSFTYKGVQKVVIGYDCLGSGREMAAIVLALAGVPPQHNSPDRDTYIQVNMKSIQPDKTKLFTPVLPQQWLFYDIKYDFKSASHYPSHKYTTDGSATIVAKNKNNEPIGEAEGFSYADVQKIRMLYNFIMLKNVKNVKLPECKTLYRPGINFKNKPLKTSALNARKKPQKYVAAAKSANEKIFDGTLTDKNEKENVNGGNGNEDETKKLSEKEDPLKIQDVNDPDVKQRLKAKPKKEDPLKIQEVNESDEIQKLKTKMKTTTLNPLNIQETNDSDELQTLKAKPKKIEDPLKMKEIKTSDYY